MATIDLHIANQKYTVKSDVAEAHLRDVATQLQEKIDAILVDHPGTAATKVALLAAVEFASRAIQGKRQVEDYRSTLLSKAGDILDRIERELTPPAH